MKILTTALLSFVIAGTVSASEVTENADCRYEVSPSGNSLEIRIDNKANQKWARFEIPTVNLPLKEGLKVTLKPNYTSSDSAVLTYKGQTLAYIEDTVSNYTKDTVILTVSSDLKIIKSVNYERRGTGLMGAFIKKEKFSCKF